MIRLRLTPLLLLGTLALAQKPPLLPPVAKVIPKEVTVHGETRLDAYDWLSDKSSPDVIRDLEAENRYTQAVMADTEKLREKLYREMLSRTNGRNVTPPDRNGDYDYYSKSEQGKPFNILCRKRATAIAREEVILDSNELAKGRKYFRLGRWAVSPNQRLLAYQVETEPASEPDYEILVKDLTTGQTVNHIPNADFSLAWASDNRTLFYVRRNPWRVFRHVLGTRTEEDVAVYQESKNGRIMLLATSSREYILTCLGSWPFSEVRYLKADRPQDEFRVIQPQQPCDSGVGRLRKSYGRGRWRKRKGRARVRLADGTIREAELHWYEATGIGRKELKIRRYLD